jgi:hypothetical protein
LKPPPLMLLLLLLLEAVTTFRPNAPRNAVVAHASRGVNATLLDTLIGDRRRRRRRRRRRCY